MYHDITLIKCNIICLLLKQCKYIMYHYIILLYLILCLLYKQRNIHDISNVIICKFNITCKFDIICLLFQPKYVYIFYIFEMK